MLSTSPRPATWSHTRAWHGKGTAGCQSLQNKGVIQTRKRRNKTSNADHATAQSTACPGAHTGREQSISEQSWCHTNAVKDPGNTAWIQRMCLTSKTLCSLQNTKPGWRDQKGYGELQTTGVQPATRSGWSTGDEDRRQAIACAKKSFPAKVSACFYTNSLKKNVHRMSSTELTQLQISLFFWQVNGSRDRH